VAVTFDGTQGTTAATVNATSVILGNRVVADSYTGVNKWSIVSANVTNLYHNQNYFANTRAGALTLNLPASANVGDTIRIIDNEGLASSNNITANSGLNLVDGANVNVIINTHRGGVTLTYLSSEEGWITEKEERESAGFQGEVSGYASGGSTPTRVNTIDKFPFAADSGITATDVGDLTFSRSAVAGQSSQENGYSSGGSAPTASPQYRNNIDKFSFAADGNATDVGDLTQERSGPGGQSSSTDGYTSGGFAPPQSNVVDKFPFASDVNATDAGDLSQGRNDPASQSSDINGYTSGGATTPGRVDTIDKFPFATFTTATDVGNLLATNKRFGGQSSTTNGYISAGDSSGGVVNVIQKFPFATDANTTDVGDLSSVKTETTGQSSTTNGYATGGGDAPGFTLVIDRFPFASDNNATNVGNLSQARSAAAGQQV
jgi:hypothetical protein